MTSHTSVTPGLILVVDDQPAMLTVIQTTLRQAGYDVVAFDDPRDAIEELRAGLVPDVIVSDVTMPGMDGFDVIQAARSIPELAQVPFLFLSAHDGREYVRKGMSLGADDFLGKPLDKDDLLAAVEARRKRVRQILQPSSGRIVVRALGAPFVEMNGARVDWDSVKALEMLVFILEHPHGVGTFEVAEALWPGKSESKASSSFHTTLYRLRKVLGADVVTSVNRRYIVPHEANVEYDVARYRRFVETMGQASVVIDPRRLRQAYGGPFLAGITSAWAEQVRHRLHDVHLDALTRLAEVASDDRRWDDAVETFRALTEHEPFAEDGWTGLARAYEGRGRPDLANQVLARFEALLEADDDLPSVR